MCRLCVWHRLPDEQVDLSKCQLDLPLHFCIFFLFSSGSCTCKRYMSVSSHQRRLLFMTGFLYQEGFLYSSRTRGGAWENPSFLDQTQACMIIMDISWLLATPHRPTSPSNLKVRICQINEVSFYYNNYCILCFFFLICAFFSFSPHLEWTNLHLLSCMWFCHLWDHILRLAHSALLPSWQIHHSSEPGLVAVVTANWEGKVDCKLHCPVKINKDSA